MVNGKTRYTHMHMHKHMWFKGKCIVKLIDPVTREHVACKARRPVYNPFTQPMMYNSLSWSI